jgi:hypothetical protein
MPQKTEANTVILRLMELLENCSEEWIDQLPVTLEEPFAFKEGEEGEVKEKTVDTPPVDVKVDKSEEPKPEDAPPAEVKGEKSEATGEEKDKPVDAPPADDEDEDEDSWND